MLILPGILFFFLASGTAFATGGGNSMLSLSAGIVTIDEFKGVAATSYMDAPFGYSGTVFLSYRYFVTSHFAIGLDDVKGNLTYGNPNFNGG